MLVHVCLGALYGRSCARIQYSSYDHVNFLTSTIHLNQHWGVWLIAASLAIVVFVAEGFCVAIAQLASRSRLGQENRRCEEARTAAEERNRAAEATKRQGQGIALLRSAALLNARVQLDPSEPNRSRLNAFLALLAEQALLDQLGPE